MKKYNDTGKLTDLEVEVLYEITMNAILPEDFTAEGVTQHIDRQVEDIEDVQKALDSLIAKGMLEVKE